MRVTRRFWLTAVASGCLTLGGWLLASALLIVGGAVIAVWLLAMQVGFVQAVTRIDSALTVDQSLSDDRVSTGTTTTFRLTATIQDVSQHFPVSVQATFPLEARRETTVSPSVTLSQDAQEASIAVPVRWETVGVHRFPGARVSVTDRYGLFSQSFDSESDADVRVVTPSLEDVHVGQGGQRLMRGVGEHEARGREGGISAEEIRKYVPGDAMKYVDWKATARLNETHVRNYEAETNREVALIVDHRKSMGNGLAGRTKLAYLTEVALAFQQLAREFRDPLGYLTVDDEGVTGANPPRATSEAYGSLRHHLIDIEPGSGTSTTAARQPGYVGLSREGVPRDTESPLYATIREYRSAASATRAVLERQLFNGFRSGSPEIRSADLLVILSDDRHPGELRDTVDLAHRTASRVVVFITPSVLFENASLSDLDSTYQEYRTFEAFRRELSDMESVTAYEVAPPDRIESVLARAQAQAKASERA